MKLQIPILCLISSILISSCSFREIANKKTELKITGSWDIQSITSSSVPDSSLLKDFEKMLHTILINASIDFAPDHRFVSQIAGKTYEGHWEAESKSSTLKLTEKNKPVLYLINFVKENKINLTTKDEKQEYSILLVRQVNPEKSKK